MGLYTIFQRNGEYNVKIFPRVEAESYLEAVAKVADKVTGEKPLPSWCANEASRLKTFSGTSREGSMRRFEFLWWVHELGANGNYYGRDLSGNERPVQTVAK